MKKVFEGLKKVFEWIRKAIGFVFRTILKLALVVAVIVIAIPVVYVWDQWDKPMTLPQAQEAVPGLTMKELVQDRLEGWDKLTTPQNPRRGNACKESHTVTTIIATVLLGPGYTIAGLNPDGKLYQQMSPKDIKNGLLPLGYKWSEYHKAYWYVVQWNTWYHFVGTAKGDCYLPLPAHQTIESP
jgi:hypothetical protein